MINKHYIFQLLVPLTVYSLVFFIIRYTQPFIKFDFLFNDLHHKIAYITGQKPDLGKEAVFILIDPKTDYSLKQVFPYPRNIIADAILKIKKYSAKLLIADYVFMGNSQNKDYDNMLASAIKDSGLVLFSHIQSDGTVYPVPDLFAKSAADTGIVSLIQDSDGIHRTTRPFYFDASFKKNYFNVVLLLALEYFKLPRSCLEFDISSYVLKTNLPDSPIKEVYYGKDCRLRFRHYYMLKDLQTVSFIDFYENKINPEIIRNKIVFLGYISNIYHDIQRTPLGNMPGIVTIYNIFLTYINNAFPVVMRPLQDFAMSILLVILYFSLLKRAALTNKNLITISMLFMIFIIHHILFCINISWNGFDSFLTVLFLGAGREIYYHLVNFREMTRIKNLLVFNQNTRLPHFSYFIVRLNSLVTRQNLYDEIYYAGIIDFVNNGNGIEIARTDLMNISRMLYKNLRYREILSWDEDRKSFYFILKGGNIHTRLTKKFHGPLVSWLNTHIKSEIHPGIVYIKIKSFFPQSIRSFLAVMNEEIRKNSGTVVFIDNLQSGTNTDIKTIEYPVNDSQYVSEQILNNIRLNEKLKLSEKEIKLSNRLASVGKIAAQIAHELKNPLGNIINMPELFEEYIDKNQPAYKCVSTLQLEAQRMKHICDQILMLSRPENDLKKDTDINEVIRETLQFLKPTFKQNAVKISQNFDNNMSPLYVNPDQIRQVLLNILLNAVDAMPGGGMLTVESVFKGTLAEIRIQDSGIGIPEDTIDKIFELFYTTKGEKGSGLGLSICFDIINKHNGRLLVDSKPGKGTMFTILLPV